jgi:hypothetical protein
VSVRTSRANSPAPKLSKTLESSFGAQLAGFAKRTGVSVDQAFRGIVIELFSSIITDTPVDTGRARGNWQTSVGSPQPGVVGRLDPVGTGAIAEVIATPMEAGDVVWLSNNLPYIGRLEYDHWSAQAPHGMVRKNMARVDGIVRDVVKGRKL